MLRSVAVLVLDELAVFEFGVLCEVFGVDRTDDGVPLLEFRVCGVRAGEPVSTTGGVQVVPEHGLEALRGADLVAIPATELREYPPEALEALRDAAAAGATLLSVCSGVFVLGAAGLLDGRRCTAHWMSVDELRARLPGRDRRPGRPLRRRRQPRHQRRHRRRHRRRAPPGPPRAGQRGGQRHRPPHGRAAAARRRASASTSSSRSRPAPRTAWRPTLDWVVANLHVEHAVADLARRAHMSERSFARRFVAETGTTPHKWLTLQRVLLAQRLLEDTDLAVDDIAERCGFGAGALLRHHFRKVVGVSPADYRRTFRAAPCPPPVAAAATA